MVQLFYFDKILKYLAHVKIFHEAKLQAFVKMQMTRTNQTLSKTADFFEN